MKRWKGRAVGRHDSYRARAAAVVEFAVVLPLLLILVLGIIEYGWLFMVRQTLLLAAQQGVRQASLQASTEPYTQANALIDDVMSSAGLSGHSVTWTHANPGNAMETVEISIPRSSVSLTGGGGFLPNAEYNLVATYSMRKAGAPLVPPPGG